MNQYPVSDDPKTQEKIRQIVKRDGKVEHIFRLFLHLMERLIAVITIVGLLGSLGLEVVEMLSGLHYFSDVSHMLRPALFFRCEPHAP